MGNAWAAPGEQTAAVARPAVPSAIAAIANDPLTRSGWERYYSLDYDKAIADFEKVSQNHPGDPVAINHLLSAVMFRELYRAGAMDR